ncbi:ABC-2 family transporter protein [Anaerotignum neopropionicum]|uniref:ABC-2 family transporter protein n=1 Tax=Anaerotignum neopropionicum TaxID=36847 RepID=A0A136WBK6_9FIRM|nr:ABC transporter permease [Anaerotignum neopropionicum]KXL51904.1 ABC-2 family transporter protein [Anaerotignum neopropionicum]
MMNPVLRREAITSLRGWKNFAVLTFYLSMMTTGAIIFFYTSVYQSYRFTFDPQSVVYLYIVLGSIQMALIVLSVPALTAGSISGERERQTLDLLLVTKLSPFSIVIGKLLSSMAFVLLLIVSTLPVFSIVFYFGSVGIGSVLTLVCFTLTTAFMLGGISVFFSCIYKKTVVSIMLVYIFTGILCFGTLLLVLLPMAVRGYDQLSTISTLIKLIPNPGVGFFSLMDNQMGTNIVNDVFFENGIGKNSFTLWAAKNLWVLHMVFQLVIGSVFIALAAGLINPVREHKQKNKAPKTKK